MTFCRSVNFHMCLYFREFVFLGLFTKSRIRELSISMRGSAHNNDFREILTFANLSSSRSLLLYYNALQSQNAVSADL